MNKKYLLLFFSFVFFTIILINGFTQTDNESQDNKISEIDQFANFTIRTSKFKFSAHYYGLPLQLRLGWFYRKNDFSIFPNIGLSFLLYDGPMLNTSTGFVLQKKYFTWEVNTVYDILPFTMNKAFDQQAIYGMNNFLFNIYGVKIGFPLIAGRRRRIPINTNTSYSDNKKQIVTELTQGITVNFFLVDLGFFKSTSTTAFLIDYVPKDNFFNYRLSTNVLALFFLYHADIVFSYSFFNTDQLKFNKNTVKQEYEIAKTQEFITGRSSFKKQIGFKHMHLFGTEIRWYPVRSKTQSNGFFLSLFTDVGFCFTKANKVGFIAEYGLGAGYTLLDSVPFTFQAGLNQKLEPVFFLGVVSRLTHLP